MNNQIKIFSLATFTFYSISNGIIYQWSFWSRFDINIMEFISINDLLPPIVFSIAIPIALLAAYAFLMTFLLQSGPLGRLFHYATSEKSESSPTGLIQLINTKENIRLKLNKKEKVTTYIISAIIIIVMITYSLYIYKNGEIKEAIFLIFSMSIMHTLWKMKEFRITLGKYAFPALLMISLMPHLMLISGKNAANKILEGKESYIIKSESICKKENKNEKYRFIANISEKAFAYSLSDKSICIFKYDSLMLIKENTIKNTPLNPLPLNYI